MTINKKDLIEICKKYGADNVGVASIDRFENVEPSGDPKLILPSVKSVLVLVHSIPRGWVRGAESHSQWETSYTRGGHLDSSLTIEIAYNICTYIEKCGFDSVPMYNYPIEMRGQGVKIKEGNPAPDVIVDGFYAAHAAGLGQFGKCGIFLTPQFGTRQQFTVILTNAEIEPDKVLNESVCDNCNECVNACYANAIDKNNFETIKQFNGEVKVYKINKEYCKICKSGILTNSFWPSADVDRTFAACGRMCIAHLEDEGLLTYHFENKFRR